MVPHAVRGNGQEYSQNNYCKQYPICIRLFFKRIFLPNYPNNTTEHLRMVYHHEIIGNHTSEQKTIFWKTAHFYQGEKAKKTQMNPSHQRKFTVSTFQKYLWKKIITTKIICSSKYYIWYQHYYIVKIWPKSPKSWKGSKREYEKGN